LAPKRSPTPSPKSSLRLDQASLLWLASVGTGRVLASLLGLRQTETGIKRARFHVLVCHGGNSRLLGLDALWVADPAPSQKPCPPAAWRGKQGRREKAPTSKADSVQGAVAPGRAPAIASDAPTLDSLLLSSVLASSLTLSCQPATRGWRLLPPGQLGSDFEVRGLSGAVVARPVHFSAFIGMPWEPVPTLPWRQPGRLAPHHLSSSVARQEDTSHSDSSTGPMAPWPPRLPQSPTSRLLVCVASRSSTALSSGGRLATRCLPGQGSPEALPPETPSRRRLPR